MIGSLSRAVGSDLIDYELHGKHLVLEMRLNIIKETGSKIRALITNYYEFFSDYKVRVKTKKNLVEIFLLDQSGKHRR